MAKKVVMKSKSSNVKLDPLILTTFIGSLASLVLFWIPVVGILIPLIVITLSIVSLNKIKKEGIRGKGFSIAALCIGVFVLILSIIVAASVSDTAEENNLVAEVESLRLQLNDQIDKNNAYMLNDDFNNLALGIIDFEELLVQYRSAHEEYVELYGDNDNEDTQSNIEAGEDNLETFNGAVETWEKGKEESIGGDVIVELNSIIDKNNDLRLKIISDTRNKRYNTARDKLDIYRDDLSDFKTKLKIYKNLPGSNPDSIKIFDEAVVSMDETLNILGFNIYASEVDERVDDHEEQADRVNFYINLNSIATAKFELEKYDNELRDIEGLINIMDNLSPIKTSFQKNYISGKRTYIRDAKIWVSKSRKNLK